MPEQTSMIQTAHKPLRKLRAGDAVDAVLLVRDREVRQKKDGSDWFALTVSDQSGETAVKVWGDSPGYRLARDGAFQPGQVVRVRGRYLVDEKWGAEIELKGDGAGVRLAQEDEIVWDQLLDGPARPVEELEAALRDVVASVQDPGLADLLALFFHEQDPPSPFFAAFRMAPAARGNHQPYRHGLLEHTLNVATAVGALADNVYPDANRSVAVAGALLHDIGKVDVYTLDPLKREMTDAGRLYGEIPMSYYRVRQAADAVWPDGLPPEVMAALHIVASHHGRVEWGAPVPPVTREAMLVHFADMIDSRIGGIELIEKRSQPGEAWSGYDRGLGGAAWLGSPSGSA